MYNLIYVVFCIFAFLFFCTLISYEEFHPFASARYFILFFRRRIKYKRGRLPLFCIQRLPPTRSLNIHILDKTLISQHSAAYRTQFNCNPSSTMNQPFDTRYVYHGTPTSQMALLCKAPSVHAYLTAGDTIRVSGFEDSLQSFVARIIEVNHNCQSWIGDGNRHPASKYKKVPLLLVQKFGVTSDDIEQNDWPALDHETAQATFGIREAAESNLCIWITANEVEEVVFLLHEKDIVEQTFGNVSGRKNCFFVRLFAKFNERATAEFDYISQEKYETFGPHSQISGGCELYTERMFFALKAEIENSKTLLYRKGKMVGPNKSITIPKSKEAWNYFKNALPSSLFTSKKRKKLRGNCLTATFQCRHSYMIQQLSPLLQNRLMRLMHVGRCFLAWLVLVCESGSQTRATYITIRRIRFH